MTKKENDKETFCPTSRKDWREWLQKNHSKKKSIWLVYHRVNSGIPSLTWSEAVDEALCFGWIDSTKKSIDDKSFEQLFSRRKPTSPWSMINKEKIEQLTKTGLMTKAGFDSVEIAKQNGSWATLDEAEGLAIPKDLEKEFKIRPGSKDFFLSLSKSTRKAILQWLLLAKREETRLKRIIEIAELASQKLKPKQF